MAKVTDMIDNMDTEVFALRIMMRTVMLALWALLLLSAAALANPYPATLDNGNLVLVDGGMGVGRYADRIS